MSHERKQILINEKVILLLARGGSCSQLQAVIFPQKRLLCSFRTCSTPELCGCVCMYERETEQAGSGDGGPGEGPG